MKFLLSALVFVLSLGVSFAGEFLEKDYQTTWCTAHHGVIEYVLEDRSRVDCLTPEYAIEFDFAPKWAESVGQSLYYATMTNHKPGIVLIIGSEKDFVFLNRLKVLAKLYGIKVWAIVEKRNIKTEIE